MTAHATSLTSEEVIRQSVILLLPAFESDMPPNLRSDLAGLTLLDDIRLWKVANSFDASKETDKHRTPSMDAKILFF